MVNEETTATVKLAQNKNHVTIIGKDILLAVAVELSLLIGVGCWLLGRWQLDR